MAADEQQNDADAELEGGLTFALSSEQLAEVLDGKRLRLDGSAANDPISQQWIQSRRKWASSFPTKEAAEDILTEAIALFHPEIQRWLAIAKPGARFTRIYGSDAVIGEGTFLATGSTQPMRSIRLVLQAHPQAERRYFILTAYPVPAS